MTRTTKELRQSIATAAVLAADRIQSHCIVILEETRMSDPDGVTFAFNLGSDYDQAIRMLESAIESMKRQKEAFTKRDKDTTVQ